MRIVPASWLPICPSGAIRRVIAHWSAGTHTPSDLDRQHYHLLIDAEGKLHRGLHSIAANVDCADGRYAAHTRGANTGAIGIALCAMGGAIRLPFRPGKWPITRVQWNSLLLACADLCDFYALEPTPTRLLMHCEAGKFLGARQLGKWDVSVLCHDRGEWKGITPGEEMRLRVARLLR
jgi:hypothetical protein